VSWQHVRGHDRLARAFGHVYRRGRLGHAYLFLGPPGVGKRRFAGELAKALLCEGRAANVLEACDRCPSCLQMDAGTHPDFLAAGRPEDSLELPIDTVRELCRGLSLKPAAGRRKVAVLDDADALNDTSANCFLKTLEEPPERAVLILVGTTEDRQLPTIVSRCQVVRFAPLPDALVAELLRAQGVEDAALVERLVRYGGGSPGQARALADPALWEFRRRLLDGLTQPRPDAVGLARAWTRFVEEAGKESAAQRQRASLVLRLLIEMLNDALALSVGGRPKGADPDELEKLQALADRTGPERLTDLLDRCLEADHQIDRRVQLVLVLEAVLDALGQKLAAGQPVPAR
jgi:DNA polymerase-3 subunit delta'